MFGDTSFWEVLLWSFFFFIWIAALMIWFRCLFDLFSDHTLSGWGKAGWAIFLVLVPWLGALVYIIARGDSMNHRQLQAMSEAKAAQDRYIQQAAAKAANPAEQIASAKQLLDSGAISQQEYDALKAKALA
jgi:hypothetical protein